MYVHAQRSWFQRTAAVAAALALGAVAIVAPARPPAAQAYPGYSYPAASAPTQAYPGYSYPAASAPAQSYPGYSSPAPYSWGGGGWNSGWVWYPGWGWWNPSWGWSSPSW